MNARSEDRFPPAFSSRVLEWYPPVQWGRKRDVTLEKRGSTVHAG